MREMRMTSRTAGVATVLSGLYVLLTLLLLYAFPFFSSSRDLSLTSVAAVAGATSVLAAAVAALAASRQPRLPLPVVAILVSVATGLVPAVIAGSVVLFNNGVARGLGVMLTILVSSIVCGLVALIRPIRTVIAGVLAAVIVGLIIRFIGTLISEIVIHWLVYSEHTPQSTLTAFALISNTVMEIVFVAIAVASVVPGVVRSGAVAGHEIRAGVIVGLLPGGFRFVSAGLSALVLLLFRTEPNGQPLDILHTAFAFAMYGLVGVLVGVLVGALVAAIVRPKRTA
jgi:hypothetical protein